MSEGRDRAVVTTIAQAGGRAVLDVHADGDHHRSVITLAGTIRDVEASAGDVVAAAVANIDLSAHHGVHPRFGAADVVPVVPLRPGEAAWTSALETRNRLAQWIGSELSVPCFLYGPERTLPDVRRSAFRGLDPDSGPGTPHPTAGASAVGTRRPLIAYNLWLEKSGRGSGRERAQRRPVTWPPRCASPVVRALGLPVRGGAQVSCNLLVASGAEMLWLYDEVTDASSARGYRLWRAEVVGLHAGVDPGRDPSPTAGPSSASHDDLTIESRWADPTLWRTQPGAWSPDPPPASPPSG